MVDEPSKIAMSHGDNNNISNRGDTPWFQPPTPISDVLPPPPPLDHDEYDGTIDYNKPITSFGGSDMPGSSTASVEPTIRWLTLAQELELLGLGCENWASEMEEEMVLELQGEYLQTTYPPQPDPPFPTSWYPPHPPTLDYTPLCIQYRPPYAWYNLPLDTHPNAPLCTSAPVPCLKNQRDHMTTTYHV
jgi:hypothetical protein